MSRIGVLILITLFALDAKGQMKVAITIDDVPNTRKFVQDSFQSKLLNQLEALNIPIAIFINEGLIYQTDHHVENLELLGRWAEQDSVTLGNHTFGHSRYSEVGFDAFTKNVLKGEELTQEWADQCQKTLKYFRFPYNDLGKDSVQKQMIDNFLENNYYTIAPFTIESSDWMFNYLYTHYQNNNKPDEAQRIAQAYVDLTLAYFHYFDSITQLQYGRSVKHVYLCHDNAINADYLSEIIHKLAGEGYSFVGLDNAMQDEIYEQENRYTKKWGISWVYRWMDDPHKVRHLMNCEPDMDAIYKEYKRISAGEKGTY